MNLCLAEEMAGMETRHREKAEFIWNIADLLRHDWKQHQYGEIILPLTVLRRFDCALEDTKEKVLARHATLKGKPEALIERTLNKITGLPFHNVSKFTFDSLLGDPDHVGANLRRYIDGFSKHARDAIRYFDFEAKLDKLDDKGLTFQVMKAFAKVDLHPKRVSDLEMGYIYEELNRKFAEFSNETAGEHFTPREVICLMAHILFGPDMDKLGKGGATRTLYDPACGTGGMLSVAHDYLRKHNTSADLYTYGQEINDETYAIALSNMLMRGFTPENVARGNSFTEDGFPDMSFDYLMANPPFGVEWKKKYGGPIVEEHETGRHPNRFHAGLPGSKDAQMLFMQHMISKMKPVSKGGGRMAIISNGSPLFTGDATLGKNETAIRRWLFENDLVEAIIALPDQLYYNTGIYTYVWVFTNRKTPEREGKVQLIDGRTMFGKMRKSMGNKRNELRDEDILRVAAIYDDFRDGKHSKIYPNEFFGYRKVTIQRPLRLNFAVTPERIERLTLEKAFQNLSVSKKRNAAAKAKEETEGKTLQTAIRSTLKKLASEGASTDQEAFTKRVKQALQDAGLKVPAPLFKAVLNALSERDEEAPTLTNKKSEAFTDPKLKDEERVPLSETNEEYFEREVRPFVPDAWIDESKTDPRTDEVGIIGYEVNFNRYFYEYKPPQPLEKIDAELKVLEDTIAGMLRQVAT